MAMVVALPLFGEAPVAAAQETIWTRQFGTAALDVAAGVALDASANAYIAGTTNGALGGQTSSGSSDVFVRRYDVSGNVLWTRQFGTAGQDEGHAVAVDAAGNVYVAGLTFASLPAQTLSGAVDAFVRKYSATGSEIWTRQFGTAGLTFAFGVAADGSGNVYVGGQTSATLPGQTSVGGSDGFVRKYDASGNVLWTRQFGTTADDEVRGLAADSTGNAYVAGTAGGTLTGQISAAGDDAFIRKYDGDGNEVWTRQFGSESDDDALSVAVDGTGSPYVTGRARGPLPGQTWSGDRDVFLRKYDASGIDLWTRQFGTTLRDEANGVAVDANGFAYIVGESRGALSGQTSAGNGDIFVRHYDPSGSDLWMRQFGTAGLDHARAVAVSSSGAAYVAGRSGAALPDQTSAGDADAFVVKFGVGDMAPPTTVASIAPAPNGAGWNNTSVAVTLTATDDGGTGVASLAYSATGAQTIASTRIEGSTAGITIASEGITTLSFAARDAAGNDETAGAITVRVDKTPPLLMTYTPLIITDATSPGGAIVEYGLPNFADALDPTPVATCSPASGTLFPIGTTTVACAAVDHAGNSTSAQFAVHVNSASAQLTVLSNGVAVDQRLTIGLRNPLSAILRNAAFFAAGAEDLALHPLLRGAMRSQACRTILSSERLLSTSGQAPAPAVVEEYTLHFIRIRSALGCT